jgi:hypothetical protein
MPEKLTPERRTALGLTRADVWREMVSLKRNGQWGRLGKKARLDAILAGLKARYPQAYSRPQDIDWDKVYKILSWMVLLMKIALIFIVVI